MRNVGIALVILFLLAAGRTYQVYPEQCRKVVPEFLIFLKSPSTFFAPKPEKNSPPPAPTVKLWEAPDVIPAEPDWTWLTSDGKIYQNVVVTKVEADAATITCSQGNVRVPIQTLSSYMQKLLNYDPDAAACVGHPPFKGLASLKEAQELAMHVHRPLAWYFSAPDYVPHNNAVENDLSQMALSHLKALAVVIIIQESADIEAVPHPVHQELLVMDDGSSEDVFEDPNIVISSPDLSQVFGRISHDKMKAGREKAIDAVLATAVIKWPTEPSPAPHPGAK
jgi:hypothetical protein